jgi:hypothetical protein
VIPWFVVFPQPAILQRAGIDVTVFRMLSIPYYAVEGVCACIPLMKVKKFPCFRGRALVWYP